MARKAQVQSVLNFLTTHVEVEGFALLPLEPKRGAASQPFTNIAAALLASGRFDVEGFSVAAKGVRCARRVPAWVHPFLYLGELLDLDADDVSLLFGPRCPNDRVMHQFEPFPANDHGLLVARLEHYLREGSAVSLL